MDTTCTKVHMHGLNLARGQQAQVTGQTKGGHNTKLAMIVDFLGRLVAMRLASGNRHDLKACIDLWKALHRGWLIPDHAFVCNALRSELASHGIFTCTPIRDRRRRAYYFNATLYAHRHTVENASALLKRFSRIGTCYDKPPEIFFCFILLAACLDWLLSDV